MYIGELSKKSGASRKAIYLYEQLGLIPPPLRKGTYRVYSPITVDQIQIIKCAQSLGFKLKELAEALANNTSSGTGLDSVLEQIRFKRQSVQLQIQAAQTQLDMLNQFERYLRESPDSLACELSVDSFPRGKV